MHGQHKTISNRPAAYEIDMPITEATATAAQMKIHSRIMFNVISISMVLLV